MKKPETSKDAADKLVQSIRAKTRQTYSAAEKIRIVLAGLRGEESITGLCRREGIGESLYYRGSKEFLEAGKRRLSGNTALQATSPPVKDLRPELFVSKACTADLTLENRLLKKYDRGWGGLGMRYPTSEKLEIIGIVEGSHLPTKKTLDMFGIPRTTFYRWYDRYLEGGFDALLDHCQGQDRFGIRCLTGDRATIAEKECRALRIALRDQFEQEFGAGFAERHQAQFVNDQQLVAD